MHAAKTLFLSLAPLMVTESLPLILVTALYELDIIRYLFFGHPTRPVPPSRRKLDYIGFLPIPEKAKSWQGSLVAVLCGLVWFFSEFTLDIILIILGVDSATDLKKQIQQHQEQLQHDEDNDTAVVQDSSPEEDRARVKANKMHNLQHQHHNHRDIYDNSEEFFADHQPQQQHHGGRRERREFQREAKSSYDASEEGGDVVEQLDLQDEFLVWNSMERSVECRDEEDVLLAVSAALSRNLTLGADAKEREESKAVFCSTAFDVVATAVDIEGEWEADLQENNERTPAAEIRLLPAHDLEHNVDVRSGPDTDSDADVDVDAEAADNPGPVSSSPFSSTSTSRTDLHETEHNDENEKAHPKGDFKENTKAWDQLSMPTKTTEAPTLDDCRTTDFIQQHGDDQESAAGVHEHPAEQQSQDQWSEWGPHQLSRAIKTVQSIQRLKQGRVVASPSSHRHMALFPPLRPLAAESTAESLSDDDRIRDEKKKMLRYAKKKKAAKAKKASDWIKYFSASDRQVHRDISARLKSYSKKAISNFWTVTSLRETRERQEQEREAQERERVKLMEERRIDLRTQDVMQLRMDDDAMTKELEAAYTLCEIKDFDKHECLKFLQKYNTPLQSNEAVVTLRKSVLRDRANLLDADSCPEVVLLGKTLRILEHLCELVLHKPYRTQKPSEHDCLNVWATIFGVLTELVTFHAGEKAQEASKMRRMQREEYGEPSDARRKVDCVFMFDGIELSNTELKSQIASPRDVSVQLRKSIRLARCIQELHLSFGFVGTFYRVVQMDDISVASEVTSAVVCLPETALGLEAFLQDESLALIYNFIGSLEAQRPVVKTAKDRQALGLQKEKFRSGLRASPGPQRARERKFVNVVTLSPAKKRDWTAMESDIALIALLWK
ncbi:hypothetical protein KI688_010282 [Linnemannia hyalina]|uniref:Uncharacterized protein n=1 Tax=Linnemannia hyalina TaxID=64524 RepID=A0A9P7XY21_9FUNG|nr:hypothetical protein KI688_010282 [Linnemannia hyalina]